MFRGGGPRLPLLRLLLGVRRSTAWYGHGPWPRSLDGRVRERLPRSASGSRLLSSNRPPPTQGNRHPPPDGGGDPAAEQAALRHFLAPTHCHPDALPRAAYTLTTSRSSGPGGQHVNKVSTKVHLHLHLGHPTLRAWAPASVLALVRARHALQREEIVVVACDRHREQARNRQECRAKLVGMLEGAARSLLVPERGEREEVRDQRITQHQAREREARLADKRQRAHRKAERRGGREGH